MSKEILLYGGMYGSNITSVIEALDEADGDPVVLRINSDGGSPEDTFGLVAKLAEYSGQITIKVDGRAHSTALFLLAYADRVEALDVSEFLLHRAAYPSYFEASDMFDAERKGNLERINNSLKKALQSKIDVSKFEALKGIKLKAIFSMDARQEVFLSAAEAKQIGLINTISKITPSKRAEIESYGLGIAAKYTPKKAEEEEEQINQKPVKMTLVEIKAKYPEHCAAIAKEGVTAERDRVGSWMGFADVDIKAVKAGIADGNDISKTQTVELSRKAFATAQLDTTETETVGDVVTEETTVTAAAAKVAEDKAKADAFTAEMNGELGIKAEKA